MIKKIIILLVVVCLGVFLYLTLYGNIEIRQVDVSFQVSGKIKEMLKSEGDEVKKDEPIAYLDDTDYKLNYEMATAEVERGKVLINEAESKYNRHKPLLRDSVTEQELTTLYNNYQQTKANYNVALVNQKIAKNKLEYTKLYAPDDGYITIRAQEPGANIIQGQTIYTITKTKPVWVKAYIEESYLGNIKNNMEVKVVTDSTDKQTNGKKEYSGYIGYVSSVAEFTPKTVQTENLRTSLVYAIRVYINDADEYLKQGMPVTVKINLNNN
jgi:HlyD family secretion protein